jgi:hypothetical protein
MATACRGLQCAQALARRAWIISPSIPKVSHRSFSFTFASSSQRSLVLSESIAASFRRWRTLSPGARGMVIQVDLGAYIWIKYLPASLATRWSFLAVKANVCSKKRGTSSSPDSSHSIYCKLGMNEYLNREICVSSFQMYTHMDLWKLLRISFVSSSSSPFVPNAVVFCSLYEI